MKVHISQFYACSEVKNACELYYICELGKYSKMIVGNEVSIDGVILNSILRNSPIWEYLRVAITNGWIVDAGIPDKELLISDSSPIILHNKYNTKDFCNLFLTTDEVPYDSVDSRKRREDVHYDIMTPKESQISFEVMTTNFWKWSPNGFEGRFFDCNNRSMNHNFSNQAFLSLVAMVAVRKNFGESPAKLQIVFDNNFVSELKILSYLIIMSDTTTAFDDWVEIDTSMLDDNRYLQLFYAAWYIKGKDYGMCNRWYSGKEKFEYLKKLDLIAGDLVFFYERKKLQQNNYMKEISSCHLAKIVSVDDNLIELELINTVKPYSTGKADFDDHTTIVKKLYAENKPYETLNTSRIGLSMADLGVEYMLYNERHFIVPMDEATDVKPVYVKNKNGEGANIYLDQNNLTYWILKDYEYEFNEERFLDKFFKYETPIYTRFMRGERLEDEYYVDED